MVVDPEIGTCFNSKWGEARPLVVHCCLYFCFLCSYWKAILLGHFMYSFVMRMRVSSFVMLVVDPLTNHFGGEGIRPLCTRLSHNWSMPSWSPGSDPSRYDFFPHPLHGFAYCGIREVWAFTMSNSSLFTSGVHAVHSSFRIIAGPVSAHISF